MANDGPDSVSLPRASADAGLLAAISEAVLRGPDAIVAADRDGTVSFWNSGAERIFGFSADEAIGQSLDLIIPVRLRDRHWEGWTRVMETGHSRYGDGDLLSVPSMRKDGAALSVEFTIHPITGDDGAMVGIAATLRDATAKYQEVRTLRRELAQLRGAGS